MNATETDLTEDEARIAKAKIKVREVKKKFAAARANDPQSKRERLLSTMGYAANDPTYDEVVRLGREYRESLRPADYDANS